DEIFQQKWFDYKTYPRDIQYVLIRPLDHDENPTVSMLFVSACILALILFFAIFILLLWKKENLRIWIKSHTKRGLENQRGLYWTDMLKSSMHGKGSFLGGFGRWVSTPAVKRADVFEIDPRNLEIDENKKLGAGEFGVVYREIYNDEAKPSFLEEIDLMKKLGYHERLVNIIACVTTRDPVCLIVEYCPLGDLLRYLRKKKAYMIEKQNGCSLTGESEFIDDNFMTVEKLMIIAWQVSAAMVTDAIIDIVT
uniref:Protein kinase domain-containing protein n=1 Tax=Romanomermis culicivorax TaxID=13658 RepID=A0A915KL80_ROMCU